MGEQSYWWTTSDPAVGDGAVSYSQADLAVVVAVLAACSGFEGAAPGYLGELAPAADGANTVRVDPGGAVVDGRPYRADAAVIVNIPSASGAGNTRIDRVVLQADWVAQTVRVTRIEGEDAASPTVPPIIQQSGATYDIPLCRVLVDTAGAVTVTDERVYAQGGANSLAAGAVTAAKIADGAVTGSQIGASAVTETKIGSRAVTAAKIGTGAVTQDKIASSAVTTDKIADGAVTRDKIGDGNISEAKLGKDAVTSTKIANGAVTALKIANDSVGVWEIMDKGVWTQNLADSAVTTDKIAAGAVTDAKIAYNAVIARTIAADAVDDTKVGARVPQFYRRQGGSSTDWSTPGNLNYTPGAVRMQAGVRPLTIAETETVGAETITFPVEFGGRPLFYFWVSEVLGERVEYGRHFTPRLDILAPTGAHVVVTRPADSVGTIALLTVHWLAIGPE